MWWNWLPIRCQLEWVFSKELGLFCCYHCYISKMSTFQHFVNILRAHFFLYGSALRRFSLVTFYAHTFFCTKVLCADFHFGFAIFLAQKYLQKCWLSWHLTTTQAINEFKGILRLMLNWSHERAHKINQSELFPQGFSDRKQLLTSQWSQTRITTTLSNIWKIVLWRITGLKIEKEFKIFFNCRKIWYLYSPTMF
jgi:hypothetical protein